MLGLVLDAVWIQSQCTGMNGKNGMDGKNRYRYPYAMVYTAINKMKTKVVVCMIKSHIQKIFGSPKTNFVN